MTASPLDPAVQAVLVRELGSGSLIFTACAHGWIISPRPNVSSARNHVVLLNEGDMLLFSSAVTLPSLLDNFDELRASGTKLAAGSVPA